MHTNRKHFPGTNAKIIGGLLAQLQIVRLIKCM